MLCFRKIPVARNFTDKRFGGAIKIFRRIFFCLAVPKIFAVEPFRVSLIRKWEIFMLKRVMSRFFLEFCCLTVPKNFVGKPFSVS